MSKKNRRDPVVDEAERLLRVEAASPEAPPMPSLAETPQSELPPMSPIADNEQEPTIDDTGYGAVAGGDPEVAPIQPRFTPKQVEAIETAGRALEMNGDLASARDWRSIFRGEESPVGLDREALLIKAHEALRTIGRTDLIEVLA